MSTGICTAHEGRHERREGCVQWDGSEETRLREELAEARRQLADARFRPMGDNHHNAAQCPYCGDPLRAATARATAAESALMAAEDRVIASNVALAAAESALSEARGALRDGVVCLRKSAEHIQDLESSASQDDWGKIKRLRNRMREQADQLDAALARAGEQEAAAPRLPIPGQPISMADYDAAARFLRTNPMARLGASTPPPGEQGKGGGEGRGWASAFQERIAAWVVHAFGDAALTDRWERTARVVEEAIELAQAEGLDDEDVYRIFRRVYARPAGTTSQEAAGLMVCFLAWAAGTGTDLRAATLTEIERIERPEVTDRIRAKQAEKAKAGTGKGYSIAPAQPAEHPASGEEEKQEEAPCGRGLCEAQADMIAEIRKITDAYGAADVPFLDDAVTECIRLARLGGGEKR